MERYYKTWLHYLMSIRLKKVTTTFTQIDLDLLRNVQSDTHESWGPSTSFVGKRK